MKIRSVQRHTVILFLIALVLVFVNGLSNGIANLLSYSMDVNAMGLAIDFTNDKALGLSVLFFLQFGLSYFILTANVFMAICSAYLIFAWLITSLLEKKLNVFVLITLLFLGWLIYCGVFNLTYSYAIAILGLILLYERTYIANKSVYEKESLKTMINHYVCLFRTKFKKVDGSVNFLNYLKKETPSFYSGNLYVTGLLSLLVVVGSVLSCGLLSGLLVAIKDQYVINHSRIDGKPLMYKPSLVIWFLNGIKWTFLTIITLGLYWLLGGLMIDYNSQRYSCIHFIEESNTSESSLNESFFDGGVSEFLLIRLVGFALTIITLGFGYAYYDHIKRRYITSHCVVDGLRLMDTSDLNSLFSIYIITYPLSVVTLGLFWIIYSGIYPCYFYDHTLIDYEPALFDEDEQYVSIPVIKKEVFALADKKEEPSISIATSLEVKPEETKVVKKPAKRSLKRKSSTSSTSATTIKNTTSSGTTRKKKTRKSSTNLNSVKHDAVKKEEVKTVSKENQDVKPVETKPVKQQATDSKSKSESKVKGSSVTVNIHSRSMKKSKGSTGKKKHKK